jgi:hypothetical protein
MGLKIGPLFDVHPLLYCYSAIHWRATYPHYTTLHDITSSATQCLRGCKLEHIYSTPWPLNPHTPSQSLIFRLDWVTGCLYDQSIICPQRVCLLLVKDIFEPGQSLKVLKDVRL